MPADASLAVASACKAAGDGLNQSTVRQQASFTVTACIESGEQKTSGGDTFFIAIRGASRVRAHVTDSGDGTYLVTYKPSVSGQYSVSISLFGEPLPGSPFAVSAYTPGPEVSKCEVRGEAREAQTQTCLHAANRRVRPAWPGSFSSLTNLPSCGYNLPS